MKKPPSSGFFFVCQKVMAVLCWLFSVLFKCFQLCTISLPLAADGFVHVLRHQAIEILLVDVN